MILARCMFLALYVKWYLRRNHWTYNRPVDMEEKMESVD